MGADKDPADILRNTGNMGQGALLHDLPHEGIGEKSALRQLVLQDLVGLDQVGVVHHVADVGIGKDGLHAGGDAGNDRQGAGGSDGGNGGVAERLAVPIDTFGE